MKTVISAIVGLLFSLIAAASEPFPLLPLQKTTQTPQATSTLPDGSTMADFGRDAFAQISLTVNASRPDTITLHLGERLDSAGRVLRRPASSVRHRLIRIPVTAGTHSYTPVIAPDGRNTGPDAIKMPEDIGEVLPFRYCEIEPNAAITAISGVSRQMVHYPFDDSASAFESSDSVLNAVWELCKYSIKATSFTGLYVDGDRERIPYEADALINQLCHYGTDASYGMARATFEHLLLHPTWPTEWMLCMPLIAYEDYMYTGDTTLISRYFDRLKANLLVPMRTSEGLISTTIAQQTPEFMASIGRKEPIRDIVDWPRTKKGENIWDVPGESDGFEFTPYNSVVNAYHYRALVVMAKMADAIGRHAVAEELRADAGALRHRFMEAFYDNENHRFADGLISDTRHASLHASIFPVAFGIIDSPSERALVGEHIRSRGMACSVYASQFLMDALYACGMGDYALDLLTATDDRSWHNMMATGSTITTEAWDDRYKTNQDWNHAWGAVPANVIPRRLVGVTPLLPGFRIAQLFPHPGDLGHFKALVPTVRGGIEVEFTQEDGNISLAFSSPVPVALRLPALLVPDGARKYRHNRHTVRLPEARHGGVLDFGILPPGTHTISLY